VTVALVLGGILLGAGILLFVAAHWDDVSPGWRLTLVLSVLALLHLAGVASRERFEGFATAMHALGQFLQARRLRWWDRYSTCRSIGPLQ